MVQENMTHFSPLPYDYLPFKPPDCLHLPGPSGGSIDGSSPPEIPRPAPSGKRRSGTPRRGKGYKHVPHREKPPHLVARRNARERRRVQAVNTAFSRLRKCVPAECKSKRLSKVKTLHRAIEYIQMLQEMLQTTSGGEEEEEGGCSGESLNKENELHQRWLQQMPASWGDENQNSCLSFYDDFADAI